MHCSASNNFQLQLHFNFESLLLGSVNCLCASWQNSRRWWESNLILYMNMSKFFVTQHSSMNFAFQRFDTSTILQAESGPECNAPRCDEHCSCSQVERAERQKVFEDVLNVSLQTTSNLLTCIQLKGPVSQPCW